MLSAEILPRVPSVKFAIFMKSKVCWTRESAPVNASKIAGRVANSVDPK